MIPSVSLPYIVVIVGSWLAFALLADRRRLAELAVYGAFSGAMDLCVMFLEWPFGWWDFTQFGETWEIMVEIIVSLSLFMVQGMLFVQYFSVLGTTGKRIALLLGLAGVNTLSETVLLGLGWVEYGNGWNPGWTFLSYALPFALLAAVAGVYHGIFRRRGL